MSSRTVTWGGGIVVEMHGVHGGLNRVVDVIRQQMGDYIGTRNTFSKLQKVDDPSHLNPRDLWRAWLLLATVGQEPRDWDVPDTVVPRSIADPEALKGLLRDALHDALVAQWIELPPSKRKVRLPYTLAPAC